MALTIPPPASQPASQPAMEAHINQETILSYLIPFPAFLAFYLLLLLVAIGNVTPS